MRRALPIVIIGLAALLGTSAQAAAVRNICGWWVNPSPGNVTLLDGRDELEIARQGAGGARGTSPRFTASQWVRHGTGSYGHGCVCLKAQTDDDQIVSFSDAVARPLARCRHDRALRRAERNAR